MRNRLLFGITGALVGAVTSMPIGDMLKLSSGLALGGCSVLGLLIGVVVSTLIDVFAASAGESNQNT